MNILIKLIVKTHRKYHLYLEHNYDKKYGVNTSGIVQIEALEVVSSNSEHAYWYEATPEKDFDCVIKKLDICFKNFTFIDFGSGKGKILLKASNFGFKKIIGVEFDKNLHCIALDNIKKYKRNTKCLTDIEPINEDACSYKLPQGQLVIYFFNPFRVKVMSKVLANIADSFNINHQKTILIFYGSNQDLIDLFGSLNFQCIEIKISPIWLYEAERLLKIPYRKCFIFTSPD